jgi:putative acetyltransferase
MIEIVCESPYRTGIAELLAESDRYYAVLYPEESNHLLDIAELNAPHVAFFVAQLYGKIAGCGALIHQENFGEIKRMYVTPWARSNGIARLLVAHLEVRALDLELHELRLETGVRQPEAIALYRALGFQEIAAFPPYAADPLSIFFMKQLKKPTAVKPSL